jgi:DnaJ homolog subfamily C member 2
MIIETEYLSSVRFDRRAKTGNAHKNINQKTTRSSPLKKLGVRNEIITISRRASSFFPSRRRWLILPHNSPQGNYAWLKSIQTTQTIMPTLRKLSDSLEDWPQELQKVTVECAGKGFVDYFGVLQAGEEKVWEGLLSKDAAAVAGGANGIAKDGDDDDGDDYASLPVIDLFSLSETELAEIDYYSVLHLPYKPTTTPDDVKKAYRRASLKYHPDKSGRGEEDAVFLKVKAAFETLSTQKLAYDSTEMPFDDSLPSEQPRDFFKEYGPVFERNLHFDARILPKQNGSSNSNGSSRRGKRNSSSKSSLGATKNNQPPCLGGIDMPIEKVHEFYDYWTHFESWRDFGLQAARELETQEHLENAESRYEKRFYQKEIDRRAKKLKQQEVIRITTLVERAMAADPRLVQERKRLVEEKERKQREREQEAADKKEREEVERLAEERRADDEKKRKAEDKFQREKEKKLHRKAKQALKRLVSDALVQLQDKEYALEDEVDFLCNELDRLKLTKFNRRLDAISASEIVSAVKKRAEDVKSGVQDVGDDDDDDDDDEEETAVPVAQARSQTGADTENCANGAASNAESSQQVKPSSSSNASLKSKVKVPFTKDELTALAKGVKKFPPGGANRWDQIATYINNLCQSENPRTKEECIETFNQLNKAAKPARNGGTNGGAPSLAVQPVESTSEPTDGWTPEQDQQLQTALAKYPATMDKNERWTTIAQEVTGKSKKDWVQRFKTIREAIKAKK